MHFPLKKTIVHVSVLTALIPALSGDIFAADTDTNSQRISALPDSVTNIAGRAGGPYVRAAVVGRRIVVVAQAGNQGFLDPSTAPSRGRYIYDSYGRSVRDTVQRKCVLDSYWNPDGVTMECHPDRFAEPATPAPRQATTPPAQTVIAAPVAAPVKPPPLPAYEPYVYSEGPTYQSFVYAEPAASAASEDKPSWEDETAVSDQLEYAIAEDEADADEDDTVTLSEVEDEDANLAADDTIELSEIEEDEDVESEDIEVVEADASEEEALDGESSLASDEEDSVEQDDTLAARTEEYEAEPPEDDSIVSRAPDADDDAGTAPDNVEAEGLRTEIAEAEVVEADEPVAEAGPPSNEPESAEMDDSIVAQSGGVEPSDEAIDESMAEPTAPAASEEVVEDQEMIAESKTLDELSEEPGDSEQVPGEPVAAAPSEPEQPPAAPPEEQVAAAESQKPAASAQEQPKPSAPQPVVLPITVTVDADALFDFDRHAIRMDARGKLDELVKDLEGVSYGEILVVGYADPIGGADYNISLSERRAEAVKRYLISKKIPAERITIEGRGETEEFASYDEECLGLRKSKLIECLQPDRRVEVTVTGEKTEK